MDKYTLSLPRNNKLYDSIMENFNDTEIQTEDKQDDNLKGYRGKCVLRELNYFDVGVSFLSDSLHNCYHGVVVSITRFDETFYLP